MSSISLTENGTVLDSDSELLPNTLRKESESLLSLAEELRDRCEIMESKRLWLSCVLVSAMLGTVALLLFGIEVDGRVVRGNIPATVAAWILATISFWFFAWRQSLSLRLRRDKRAMFEIVDMLREIEKAIADHEQFSSLERARFRIRVSRFGIGNGLNLTRTQQARTKTSSN